jgi:CheY-like chemotaxis protein
MLAVFPNDYADSLIQTLAESQDHADVPNYFGHLISTESVRSGSQDKQIIGSGMTKRVLIIDDEAILLEVVQGCLEDIAGWTVLTANSGWEGLSKAATEQPDAIVLDVMMPGMDGLALLQRLKADSETQAIPVVLLTAKVELTDPRRNSGLDVVGIIAKPFEPFQLVEQLATVLGWSL